MDLSDIPFIIPQPTKNTSSIEDVLSDADLSAEDWEIINTGQCTRCGLCKSRRNCIPPKIVPDCDIMFIAEAPSDTEDMWGTEPLIGDAGEKFNELLQIVGIDRNVCSIANTVQCRPPSSRVPETCEIKACAPILEEYIRQAKPKIIVPLGAVALRRICGKAGITKLNAPVIEHARYPGVKIVPVFSPSYVLRDARNQEGAIRGLMKAKDVLEGGGDSSFSEVTFVDTIEKFDAMMAKLTAAPAYALDIETTGLDFRNELIICMSFACEEGKSYVLPWTTGDEAYYKQCREFLAVKRKDYVSSVKDFCELYRLNMLKPFWTDPHVKESLQTLFKSSNIKVLHNFKFDLKFLRKAGFDFDYATVTDTMLISYLLDERRGNHGLKDQSKIYTKFGAYEDTLTRCGFKKCLTSCDTYGLIPLDILAQYAGTDADATLQIYYKMLPKLESENLVKFLKCFLLPLSQMLMEVEEQGVQVDDNYMADCIKVLTAEIKVLDLDFEQYKWPSGKVINFNSNKQLMQYLYNVQGLPILGHTDKGAPSVAEDVLEKLSTLHDVPGKLLRRRKLAKALSTYFIGVKECQYDDGKIRPSFLVHGTETGRLSAKSPNCQNWPRATDQLTAHGVNIRNLFICSRPDDYCLFEVDYSQAELRLIAEYSRDVRLYGAFLAGKDPHAMLAVHIYHPELVEAMERGEIDAKKVVTKEERQNGKTGNFELCYGKHWKNFAREHNMDKDVAKQIYDVYWATYTGVKAWQTQLLDTAKLNKGVFTTYFGRKRRIPQLLDKDFFKALEASRQGVNFVIQAQASDYTLYSAMKVRRELLQRKIDACFISFVHDSIVGEVHRSHLNKLLDLLQEVMVHPPGITIPMEIETKVGYRLGALEVVKFEDGIWQIPKIVA